MWNLKFHNNPSFFFILFKEGVKIYNIVKQQGIFGEC